MKIPRYDAQVPLTKQAPGVMVDASAYGQQARAMGDIGNVITQFGIKLKEIRKEDEINKATISAKNLLNQAEWDAMNDTDLNDYEARYEKRLDEVRQSVIAGIQDREASVEFGNRLDLALTDSKFKIKQYYRNKTIDSARATLSDNLNILQNEYVNTNNQDLKDQKLQQIKIHLDKAAIDGLMKREDATNSFLSIKSNLPERQAAFDAANRPEQYFANRGSYGIAADKLADTDKIAEKTLSEVKVISLQDQFVKQKEYVDTLEGKPISQALNELQEGKDSLQFDDKWADSMKRVILSNAGINQDKMNKFESDIIMSIADVSAQYKVKTAKKRTFKDAQEYLNEMRKIEIQINDGRAKGYLTKSQANTHLNKLYGEITAEATEKVIKGGRLLSYNVADADKYIFKKTLGTADRYRAIREFFWETGGKDMDKKEGSAKAAEIADRILNKTRTEVLEENDKEIEGSMQYFNTSEEADNSGLPKGTIVNVGGRRYEI